MSFRPIIARWPTKAALAADLEVKHGLVQAWWNRDSIPVRWWPSVVRSADRRGISGVTADALTSAAQPDGITLPVENAEAP